MSENVIVQTIIYNDKWKGLKELYVNNGKLVMLNFDKWILSKIDNYQLLENNAIYFLFNNEFVYVGQTNNLKLRISQHIKDVNKKFTNVIAIVSDDDSSLSRTFIDYLEWYYIDTIRNDKFYKLVNNSPRINEPKISKFEKIDINNKIKLIENLFFSLNISFKRKQIEKYIDYSINTNNFIKNNECKNANDKKYEPKNENNLTFHSKLKISDESYDSPNYFVKKERKSRFDLHPSEINHFKKIKSKVNYENIVNFLNYYRSIGKQEQAEKDFFGLDEKSLGWITSGLNKLIGIDIKVIKKMKHDWEFEEFIDSIKERIIYAVNEVKKI